MHKNNGAAIGNNQQNVGLKIPKFRLYYITMYFADIECPDKESLTTQAFGFSRFKKQAPKLLSWLSYNLSSGYRGNTKRVQELLSQVLPVPELSNLVRHLGTTKNHINDLIMTSR